MIRPLTQTIGMLNLELHLYAYAEDNLVKITRALVGQTQGHNLMAAVGGLTSAQYHSLG